MFLNVIVMGGHEWKLLLEHKKMGKGSGDKPPTGSLYPRESYVCFFIFLVELAAVGKKLNV